MSKKKKKQPSRPQSPPGASGGNPPLLKRRMPRPTRTAPHPLPPPVLYQAEPHPRAGELADKIRQFCRLAHLNPFVVWRDFVGMAEAGLTYQAENARSYALTGQFIQDPPPVAAHFKQARERYLRAAETYPAAYRVSQETFMELMAELQFFTGPGLGWYAEQTALNPDMIGQVFLELFQPGLPQTIGGSFHVKFDENSLFARWLTKFLKWQRYQGRYYGNGGIFIRKQVFLELGGFQPYDLLEDYDLARRMENYGPTLYLPETVIASPRKFQGRKLKAALTWLIIQSLFMLGVHPNRLARWYRL